MRFVSCVSLLSAVSAFQLAPLGALPRAKSLMVLSMAEANAGDGVKITIRKREAPPPAPRWDEKIWWEDTPVFVLQFSHVKQSLAAFLKFWLMGGCGAKGWSGTGELEAEHSSGTKASIEVDVEKAKVTLISRSDPSYNSKVQLTRYAKVLLDELEGIATNEEAAAADRLCYPCEAIQMARASLPPRGS